MIKRKLHTNLSRYYFNMDNISWYNGSVVCTDDRYKRPRKLISIR